MNHKHLLTLDMIECRVLNRREVGDVMTSEFKKNSTSVQNNPEFTQYEKISLHIMPKKLN